VAPLRRRPIRSQQRLHLAATGPHILSTKMREKSRHAGTGVGWKNVGWTRSSASSVESRLAGRPTRRQHSWSHRLTLLFEKGCCHPPQGPPEFPADGRFHQNSGQTVLAVRRNQGAVASPEHFKRTKDAMEISGDEVLSINVQVLPDDNLSVIGSSDLCQVLLVGNGAVRWTDAAMIDD